MRNPLIAVVALLVVVAGCGGDPESEAPAVVTSGPVVAASPSATAVTAIDAAGVIERLKKADLGLTNVAAQDEDTDPNNLLGRPNGYLTRSSADLPGGDTSADKYTVDRGLVVEGCVDAETAKRRSDYIQGLLKDVQILGSEWHYLTGGGTVLVRVSGNVKPSLAKKIESALG